MCPTKAWSVENRGGPPGPTAEEGKTDLFASQWMINCRNRLAEDARVRHGLFREGEKGMPQHCEGVRIHL